MKCNSLSTEAEGEMAAKRLGQGNVYEGHRSGNLYPLLFLVTISYHNNKSVSLTV